MNTVSVAAVVAAVALLIVPDGRAVRRLAGLQPKPGNRPRRQWLPSVTAVTAATLALALGVALLAIPAGAAGWWLGRRFSRSEQMAPDPFRLAITWELFAAALRAGLPVATAVRAVAEDLAGPAGVALRATSDLLTLGADPVHAWEPALACTATAPLARAARRTARSGAALAGAATALADDVRSGTQAAAEARAQRAAVLISGPLGLCFLPAFVCLGIVPVVAGLAEGLF